MPLLELLVTLSLTLAGAGAVLYIIVKLNREKKLEEEWKKILAALLAVILVLLSGWSVHQGIVEFSAASYAAIPSSGLMVYGTDFNVYWDVTGAQIVKSVNWGTISPGGKSNVTVYIKNQSAKPLYCNTSWDPLSWQPVNASKYFAFSWTFGSSPVGSLRVRKVNMTLTVLANITGITSFSFTIDLYGQDTPF